MKKRHRNCVWFVCIVWCWMFFKGTVRLHSCDYTCKVSLWRVLRPHQHTSNQQIFYMTTTHGQRSILLFHTIVIYRSLAYGHVKQKYKLSRSHDDDQETRRRLDGWVYVCVCVCDADVLTLNFTYESDVRRLQVALTALYIFSFISHCDLFTAFWISDGLQFFPRFVSECGACWTIFFLLPHWPQCVPGWFWCFCPRVRCSVPVLCLRLHQSPSGNRIWRTRAYSMQFFLC